MKKGKLLITLGSLFLLAPTVLAETQSLSTVNSSTTESVTEEVATTTTTKEQSNQVKKVIKKKQVAPKVTCIKKQTREESEIPIQNVTEKHVWIQLKKGAVYYSDTGDKHTIEKEKVVSTAYQFQKDNIDYYAFEQNNHWFFVSVNTAPMLEKKKEKEKLFYSTKELTLFQQLDLSKKKESRSGLYKMNGYYTINGKRYYSIYKEDQKGKTSWLGYGQINQNDWLHLKKEKKLMSVKKESPIDATLFHKVKNTKAKLGKCYYTRGYYTLGKKKYYSIENQNHQWQGYIESSSLIEMKAKTLNKEGEVQKKDYTLWSNFFWSKKKGNSSSYLRQTVKVKKEYRLGNGTKYYSIYSQKNKWLGYINAKAIHFYIYKKLDVKYYNQYEWGIPTGCEGVALLQALQYKGYAVKETPYTFLKKIPRTNSPLTGFGGNPFLGNIQNGFPAINAKPLAKWGRKFGKVSDVSGRSLRQLLKETEKGNTVVLYVTPWLQPVRWGYYQNYRMVYNNHAVTLSGYDEKNDKVYLSDSISGRYWVQFSKVEKVFNARKWAVLVQ